ncbi:MAG: 5-methylthioadenosine/S-adenosylhomocysteine deaminase [Acidobacteriota bacterium]
MLRAYAALVCAAAIVSAQPARRAVALVVTGGIVVTVDPAGRVLAPGALAIDGRDIVGIGTPEAIAAGFDAGESIDATGHVVMPGLVNTHTHAAMVLYRGLADDLALMDWLQKYIFPAEAKTVTPAFVRAGTRLAALEMIQSGTTTYADMYYFEEEVARVTKEAGLRGVLGQTIIQFPVADARTPAEGLTRAEAFLDRFADDDLVVPALAPHSMYTLDSATLQAVRTLADRKRAPVLIHLAETAEEDTNSEKQHHASPTRYLESLNFWGPRTVAAHGVWLSPADMAILASRHVGVSHNPESNMKLASGAAKVVAMRAAGVRVGLGTDGAASNNDLDMFEAMRQAAFLAKLETGDPRAVPARTAVEMATIDGARILGLDAQTGSLETGKRADLIVVALGAARQVPMYDPLSHLVYVTRGDDVTTTIVNGRVLMRDRKVQTLPAAEVLADARALAAKVREAVK